MKGLRTIIWLLGSILAVNAAKFQKASAAVSPTGDLSVSWTEVGLGNGDFNYLIEADASATYACFNKGGKNPQATNKQTVTGTVTQSDTFTSDKNGKIVGTATVSPVPANDFSCPAGQTRELAAVSYTNVEVNDLTNGDSVSIPGVFSKTFISLRK